MAFSLAIPAWEQTQLQDLYQYGELGNVNPLYIALIDQAESGGQGSGTKRSSTGAGGFFGLYPGETYATGDLPSDPASVSDTVLSGTDASSFDQQAVVAAGEFSALLNQFGGNPIEAENAYQGGPNQSAAALSSTSTEGGGLFAQALGGNSPPTLATGAAGPPASGQPTTSGSTGDTSSVTLTGFGDILQSLDNVMNPQPPGGVTGGIAEVLTLGGLDTATKVVGLAVRLTFAAGFLGVLYFGVKALSSGGGSSSPGIIDTLQTQQRINQGNQRLDQAGTRIDQTTERIAQGGQRLSQNETEGTRRADRAAVSASDRAKRTELAREAENRRKVHGTARIGVAKQDADTRAKREARIGKPKSKTKKVAGVLSKDAVESVGGVVAI